MRKTSLLALCALLICSRAFATLWQGTITQTVTETNDPLYSLGQSATGWYQYESDTIDGHFGSLFYSLIIDPTANPTLTGEVYIFSEKYSDGWFEMNEGSGFTETNMVVTNEQVSDFHRFVRTGATQFGMSSTSFQVIDQTNIQITTKGTVQFSAPSAVPETFSVAAAMLSSLAGLILWRRRVARG